jgi:hypothetical protein
MRFSNGVHSHCEFQDYDTVLSGTWSPLSVKQCQCLQGINELIREGKRCNGRVSENVH